MSDYIKQLESQNEELKHKLANAELIQDVVKFASKLPDQVLLSSSEALQDLQNMHSIDLDDAICKYAVLTFLNNIAEKYPGSAKACEEIRNKL